MFTFSLFSFPAPEVTPTLMTLRSRATRPSHHIKITMKPMGCMVRAREFCFRQSLSTGSAPGHVAKHDE
ncbi:hypothetical protein B0T18DRAFT_405285 [Schizothecium vesticola]|uniref:Uncharacterized protein n=1 Tax=Schizothecium vesticola TaxID=314040 RepID=A0AA40F7M0_9PEZI|nr:hypothetical protein B0T18DRAFT_405285 [Schizothecium vesticola]